MFDSNVLRFNQISIVTLLLLAAVLNQPVLVGLVAAVMLLGTFEPRLALFKRLYADVLRSTFRITSRLVEDDPRPHNFAQGLGGVFLLVSSLAFLLVLPVVGWVIAALVVALALLNLTTGICVGCFLYFQWKMLPHRLQKLRP
jgi:uncharacterized membrane protein YhaH (DUF805 family)